MEGRRRRAQEAAQQADQLRRQANAMEDRIRLLTEMEKEYEGFSRAVKAVMQAADRSTLSGIRGPVASLMSTQPQYTVALEIALGAALQNIVVDRDTDAKEAISFLKRRDAGRATFLPMSAIRGDMLREPRLSQEYGFVGIASQLVTYDPQYDGIFQNLLGRTVVVEDLDCGVNMARRYQNRFRIVTLDGQVINRGGSMTGGSVSRSAGVLSRASELAGPPAGRRTWAGTCKRPSMSWTWPRISTGPHSSRCWHWRPGSSTTIVCGSLWRRRCGHWIRKISS